MREGMSKDIAKTTTTIEEAVRMGMETMSRESFVISDYAQRALTERANVG